MCGIPASGKTTLSKQLKKENNAVLHCFDDLEGSHSFSKYLQVRANMWDEIIKELLSGNNVICDDTHHKKQWRINLLNTINTPCKKVLVVMTTPLEECLKRNINREARLPNFILHDIYNNFEVPTLDEGWDEIIYY